MNPPETTPAENGTRATGALLSLIVPGFGLVWAGRLCRGIAWFALVAGLWATAMVLPWVRDVKWTLMLGVLVSAVLATVLMLVDCARPGRPNGVAWGFLVVGSAVGLLFAGGLLLNCRQFRITSGAMSPTLQPELDGSPGDRVLVERLSYRFSKPRRGELVVFRTTGLQMLHRGGVFVFRLVGMPGERIAIRDGKVWADGRPLGAADGIPERDYQVPAGAPGTTPALVQDVDYLIPANGYFVLGDNTNNAFDSRYWGHVPERNLIGRVAWIVFPPSRAGKPE